MVVFSFGATDPKELLLRSYFLDDIEKLIDRFESKNSCKVKYNIEVLSIKKTK